MKDQRGASTLKMTGYSNRALCSLCLQVMITCLTSLIILLGSPLKEAVAAPDDRGSMGSIYGLGLGGMIITGAGSEGERLPSQYGGSISLMLGEEVIPRLFVGIGIDAHIDSFSAAQEPSLSQLFAFGLEGRYRLTAQAHGLLIIGGIGIGAGGYAAEGESILSSDSSGGGSVWKLGLGYELGGDDKKSGLFYIPQLVFQRLGPQMDSSVAVNAISLSLELLYASGRESDQ